MTLAYLMADSESTTWEKPAIPVAKGAAELYVNTLNVIQYMHDKYYYEAAEMALIDTDVRRTFATGIAGFSM